MFFTVFQTPSVFATVFLERGWGWGPPARGARECDVRAGPSARERCVRAGRGTAATTTSARADRDACRGLGVEHR